MHLLADVWTEGHCEQYYMSYKDKWVHLTLSGDYTALSESLIFPTGSTVGQMVCAPSITIVDDGDDSESQETFSIQLVSAHPAIAITGDSVTVIIPSTSSELLTSYSCIVPWLCHMLNCDIIHVQCFTYLQLHEVCV